MSDSVTPEAPAGTTTLTATEAGAGTGGAPPPVAGTAAASPVAAVVPPSAAADGKPATGEAGAPPPPVADFELKLPPGIKADAALTEFRALAKEQGLKPEAAQKVVDVFAKAQQAANAAQAAELDKLQTSWTESLKADKAFGGVDFDKNVQVARKAMVAYGDAELKSFLETSGLGNHPALVRAFHKAGLALREDSVAGSGNAGGTPKVTDPEAQLRARYPSMYPPKES